MTLIDKRFAPLSLVLLFVFMAIIIFYVPHIDLALISLLVLAFAAYDFWRHFVRGDETE